MRTSGNDNQLKESPGFVLDNLWAWGRTWDLFLADILKMVDIPPKGMLAVCFTRLDLKL